MGREGRHAHRHDGAFRRRQRSDGGQELFRTATIHDTQDGMAVWVPWARVLVCGDYLSPVEIPIPTRDAFLHDLAKVAPPPTKPSGLGDDDGAEDERSEH